MQLKCGDILLCRTPFKFWNFGSYISWAISKIEHCPWSHVAWVCDELHALEALAEGTVLTKLSKFKLNNNKFVKVVRIKQDALPQEKVSTAVEMAKKDYLGNKYDYLLILKLAWYWMTKRRHKDPLPVESHHESICTEDIAMPLWELYGFRFRKGIPPQNTAPSDIARSDKVEEVI